MFVGSNLNKIIRSTKNKMRQSDLSKLQTFIRTLPEDKVLKHDWDERYIEDINTYVGYDAAKSLAIKRDRYVKSADMRNYGYSLGPYEGLCDDPSHKKDNECHSCCSESPVTETGCKYDEEKCNSFFAENIHNWSELCGYHILFLEGKTPGTPGHPGPWNQETKYILDPLIRILSSGILTVDSQPGLMIYDKEYGDYIQKPYLTIGGPAGRIHRILIKLLYPVGDVTLDNSIIKYVPHHGIRELEFWGYENYKHDEKDYVRVMLGIDDPSMLSSEVMGYIFSNRFFDRIGDIVETTG